MKNINIMKNIHSFIKSNCGIGGISSVSRRFLVLFITLLSLGVGNAWASRTFSGGEILYLTGGKYSNGSSDWGYDNCKILLRISSENNTGAQIIPVTAVADNSGYYQAIIPAGNWGKILVIRTTATSFSETTWGGGSVEIWNRTNEIEVDGTANLLTSFKENNNDNSWKWMIPKGATFYIDKTNIGTWGNNYYLRIGRDNHAQKYDFSGTLVSGTNNLYKCTMPENYVDYSRFVVSNNYGYTGNNQNIVNIGGGSGNVAYISHQTVYVANTTLTGTSYTFIPTGQTNMGDNNQCTYHTTNNYQGSKIFTITNRSVAHATVELYYWDESNVMQTVEEGRSVQVLPTTKVWCKVTPDNGYVVRKVNLYDPSEREWTDASNDGSGRNLYIVRTNVEFEAVIDSYATKTVLIKDVNNWAPNMYFKGWNPFLYDGYNNNDYRITTQKVSNKVTICGDDYYIVTFTNEFPFYYMHNANESSRTAFFTPSRLTHMAKYNNTTSGNGDWGLQTTDCDNDIYWVETSKAGKSYISNVVATTEETLSFYVPSGGSVQFHKSAETPVEQYSVFASFFNTGGELDGKSGGVFTAKTNGSGLTDVAVYDGDYHIHVNATTRNYLSGGESKPGTNGTRFIKFNKSSIFRDTYDHYWVDWFLGSGDSYGKQSVVATVGNEYNANLAGVLGADSYAPEGMTENAGGNVRYGYDPETNFFERAIVSGGGSDIKIKGNASGEIMVLNGSDYTDDAYDAARSFSDASNWNYQIKAKVKGGRTADVTTTYNGKAQTLADNKKLIQGIDNTQYTVEITYDFRTNRIIAAWTPDGGDISTTFDLQANMLVERVEDGKPTVLNITNNDALLTNVTQIYTAMKFTRDNWADASRTIRSGVYTDAYYWISLPYDCNVGDIFGIPGYGDAWVIQTYHGDYRAQQGWWAETDSWWYDMDLTGKMEANRGYVIRLTNLEAAGKPFNSGDITEIRLYFPSARTDVQVGVLNNSSITTTIAPLTCEKWNQISADAAGAANHGAGNPRYDRRAIDSNWNLIGSPSFNTAKITTDGWETGSYPTEQNEEGTPLKYFFTWAVSAGAPVYTVQTAEDYNFTATHAYLAQYAGDITWTPVTSNPLVGLKAPKRQEATQEQNFKITLSQEGAQADVAYISRMAEGATEDYDLNLDLSKLMNNRRANIYSFAGLYKMAGNCLPDTVNEVALGVQVPAAGEYTFSIPDGTNGIGVTLIDNVANTRTNLALTDYTVTLEKGTFDSRFALEISPVENTTTGLEPISGDAVNDNNGAWKRLIDNQLYIVRDGKVFDARGARIQ